MTTKHKLNGVVFACFAVEDGVDEFRNWAEKRAEQGKTQAQSAQASGRSRGRKATESQKATAHDKKDESEDALSDLNHSTNRLRRKFDPIDTWMKPGLKSNGYWRRTPHQSGPGSRSTTARRPSGIGVC